MLTDAFTHNPRYQMSLTESFHGAIKRYRSFLKANETYQPSPERSRGTTLEETLGAQIAEKHPSYPNHVTIDEAHNVLTNYYENRQAYHNHDAMQDGLNWAGYAAATLTPPLLATIGGAPGIAASIYVSGLVGMAKGGYESQRRTKEWLKFQTTADVQDAVETIKNHGSDDDSWGNNPDNPAPGPHDPTTNVYNPSRTPMR